MLTFLPPQIQCGADQTTEAPRIRDDNATQSERVRVLVGRTEVRPSSAGMGGGMSISRLRNGDRSTVTGHEKDSCYCEVL